MEVTMDDAARRLERWLEEGRALLQEGVPAYLDEREELRRRLELLRSRQAAVAERFAEVRALFDQLRDRLAEIGLSIAEGDGAADAGP